MPGGWKSVFLYSKSGLNRLKRKCPISSSDENSESESTDDEHGEPALESVADSRQIQYVVKRRWPYSEGSADTVDRGTEHDSEESDRNSDRSECTALDQLHSACQSELEENEFRNSENAHETSERRSIDEDLLEGTSASSEDDDDDSENDIPNAAPQRNNEPLYEAAPLTVGESLLATMSMIVRHKMSKAMQSDLLKYAKLHCPTPNKCPSSVHSFRKFFSEIQTPLVRHFYCATCDITIEDKSAICPECREQSSITYFLEASITSQLRALFKRPGFHDNLQQQGLRRPHAPGSYSDIYDGAVYRELQENGGLLSDPSNISFTMYVDGVSIFRTSKFNIWPVYFVINELPYAMRMREENVLLVALWFGESKPSPNLFLTPLLESIRELREGIAVEVPGEADALTVKGIVICFTCDLPAKALFYNMVQYNGKFGCQKCKQKGEYLPNEHVHVYPYEPLNLRTEEETALHSRQAFDAGISICGVKGPTIMKHIVHNYIRAIAVDVMHVLEGVVKKLLNCWFSEQFSDHPSSIIEHIDLVDLRLRSLTPPSSTQRLPRSIKIHLSYWRTHELKSWLLYYSIPCISDLMTREYFEHHALFVLGISLLSKSCISQEDLIVASDALNEYVRRFDVLYGRRHMSNNVHQLLHLSETVRQFGPLWTTSCFPFEDLNGKLKRLVHGSNCAQLQIYTGVSKFLHLATLKSATLIHGRSAYEFCENLEAKCQRMKRYFVANSVYIVGTCTQLQQLSIEIAEMLQRLNIRGPRFFYYRRLLKHKMLYISKEYGRNKRTNSSFASYLAQDDSTRVGQIRCFIRVVDCLCREVCCCLARNFAILQPCRSENKFTTPIAGARLKTIHNILGFEDQGEAVDISNLRSVCFYCNVEDIRSIYVIEPVNSVEFE